MDANQNENDDAKEKKLENEDENGDENGLVVGASPSPSPLLFPFNLQHFALWPAIGNQRQEDIRRPK